MTSYSESNVRNELADKLQNNINNPTNDISEPLLNSENNRLTVLPIKFPKIWDAYKQQQAAIWKAEELDFSKDYDDFIKLSNDEQHFIKMVLAFFAASDTIVNINLGERFKNDVKVREAIIAYSFQEYMECVHSEVYSLQISNIVRNNDEEKNKLFNAIRSFPCVAEKAAWATKWIESKDSFATRLIAFAIVEGVFFSGAFCSIFWLKKRNIMPGLVASNEFIARDEGMHASFAVLLYSMLNNKLAESDVHAMFLDAVNVETIFICESLPCALIGMNSNHMTEYIKFVADRLLVDLGYNKFFNGTNPFDFMESISVEGKTNFFEHRPTQYRDATIGNNSFKNEDSRKKIFVMTDDF